MLLTIGLVACGGGGGGGGGVAPIATTANVQLKPVTIGPGQAIVDLTVSLVDRPALGPALLQGTLILPPELSLPTNGRLAPAIPVVTLDGDFTTGNEFTVLCGDATNQDAQPLPVGPLFQIRLMPSEPRQLGTYTVTLDNVRASTSAGDSVQLALTTLTAIVTIE
jgi:hypothetical protein